MMTQPQDPGALLPPDDESIIKPMTLTLYANGHLVPCDASDVTFEKGGGVGVTVTFQTTKNAFLAGTGDPRIERTWGDKQSGQMWYVQQPHPDGKQWPRSGVVIIQDVVVPADESDGVKFVCRAQTELIDWNGDGRLAECGQIVELPNEYLKERAERA